MIPLLYFDKMFLIQKFQIPNLRSKKELKRIAMPLLTTIKGKTQGPCFYLNECIILYAVLRHNKSLFTQRKKKLSIIKPTHKRQILNHHRVME